ncbi:MAG: WbqC family protein [Candidatus Cryptobacteroides sp.]
MSVLLSTAYFPPVSYFAAMASGMEGLHLKGGDRADTLSSPLIPSVVYLEACENFQKQSYRTRCRIYAADGVQDLSVPVVHDGKGGGIPIASVRVDYSKPWLIQHQRAIVSAYRTSAYFEYYQDELFSIMDSRPETLLELNTRILRFFISKTGLAVDLRMTDCFFPDGCQTSPDGTMGGCTDLRTAIHPKRPDTVLADLGLEKPYFQVFSPKYGFKSNLSIMDLLFNEGPDSILYLYPALA